MFGVLGKTTHALKNPLFAFFGAQGVNINDDFPVRIIGGETGQAGAPEYTAWVLFIPL